MIHRIKYIATNDKVHFFATYLTYGLHFTTPSSSHCTFRHREVFFFAAGNLAAKEATNRSQILALEVSKLVNAKRMEWDALIYGRRGSGERKWEKRTDGRGETNTEGRTLRDGHEEVEMEATKLEKDIYTIKWELRGCHWKATSAEPARPICDDCGSGGGLRGRGGWAVGEESGGNRVEITLEGYSR